MTIKKNCYMSNIPLKLNVVGLMTLCCFNTVSALVCKSLTASEDTQFILSHPQYGQRNYSNKYKACWILTAETGTKVVGITRHDFVLENSTSACSKDVLQIFDSNTDSGKSIKFCGVNIFKNLYSSQEFMYLKFSTNNKKQFEGFNISFKQYSYSVYKSGLWSSKYYKYPEENHEGNGGFNTGGIVGIVIGVGISSYIVCLAMNKRKQRKQLQVQAANQARAAQPAASSASNSASNQSASTQGQTSSTQGQATTTLTTTPTVSVVGTNDLKSTVLPPDAAPPSYIDLFGALPLPPAYGNPPQTSRTTEPLASAAYLAPTSVEEPS